MNGLPAKTIQPFVQDVSLLIGIDRRNFEQRFWTKVDKNGAKGCWIWTGAVNTNGYGHLGIWVLGQKHTLYAHRVSLCLAAGTISTQMEVDHLCHRRDCVNPAHLEEVPRLVNILRSASIKRKPKPKLFCKRGHPFVLGNTYISPGGKRRCKICKLLWARERRRIQHENLRA